MHELRPASRWSLEVPPLMLPTPLSRLYLAIVTTAVTLWAFCLVDQKWFDSQMFPYPNPNAWTWSLWIAIALTGTPWILAGAVLGTGWALERTIGVPSKMQPAPQPVRSNVIPYRRDQRFDHPVP